MSEVLGELVAALKRAEPSLEKGEVHQLGVLLGDDPDDGLDAEALRVLAAWMMSEHAWTQPRAPRPQTGASTKSLYDWMVLGMNLDYMAIADAAGVTRNVARIKLAQLIGARMIYADGTIARAAKVALEAGIARRVKKAAPKPAAQPAAPKPPPPKATN